MYCVSCGTLLQDKACLNNLLVKSAGENKYHVETFEDRFIVPTAEYAQEEKQ